MIDFGLAVKSSMRSGSLSVPPDLRATRDKSVTGTIKYAAPEQLGERPYPVGPHSDVYAFGKTALEALVGTVQPTPRHWKQIPEAVADLLARCVEEEFFATDPLQGRFHTLGPILEHWKSARSTKVNPSPVPVTPIPPTKVSRPTVAPTPPPKAKVMPTTGLRAGDRHEITLPGGVTMAFAWCPPGSFLMGSPESEKGLGSDDTQHRVILTQGYWMGIHPVTVGAFAEFVKATNFQTESETNGGAYQWIGREWKLDPKTNWRNPGFDQSRDHPVTCVSCNDTERFLEWVRKETKFPVGLPTEAQWEYAARAGTQTPFYWGDQLNGTQANCDGNYPYGTSKKGPFLRKTTPVGQYADKFPHPWGLTDVIGNVWEWCADWYGEDYYDQSPGQDPLGPPYGSSRVFRGGSWRSNAGYCRVAYRGWFAPGDRRNGLGFRLAADPSGLDGNG